MALHMPRKARIDAPGALHHIICRGLKKPESFVMTPTGIALLIGWVG
jgi:hypothetical protein